jgi:hypothetical protein
MRPSYGPLATPLFTNTIFAQSKGWAKRNPESGYLRAIFWPNRGN